MKKNKKAMNATPVIETKEVNNLGGTVAGLKAVLEQFPDNAQISFAGDFIDVNLDDKVARIHQHRPELLEDEVESYDPVPVYDEHTTIMNDYLFGSIDNKQYMNQIRHAASDEILEQPLMLPNQQELDYETKMLHDPQTMTIDEIRRHNVMIAELMGELHRRQVAALLEYGTQCLAHFGVESNRVMCNIVNGTETHKF